MEASSIGTHRRFVRMGFGIPIGPSGRWGWMIAGLSSTRDAATELASVVARIARIAYWKE